VQPATTTSQPATTSEEALWRGVLDRNETLDGRIFYGVRSTGIYCRPSCPSRRPHRRHVSFFRTPEAAEGAGFRPCKRCLPRVHAEAAAGRARAEELRLAAQIQRSLLPAGVTVPDGWDLAFASTPCREVGGDHVDVFWRQDGEEMVVALGDVAGKGAPAAFVMCSLHAGLRAQLGARADLPEAMAGLDRYLAESTPGNRFATLFLGRLDPAGGLLTYVNAGHPPGLVFSRDGEIRSLEPSGRVLGLLPGTPYVARRVRLRAGDALLLYSDGVTETPDRGDRELGLAALGNLLRATRGQDAAAIGNRLEAAVREHGDGRPPQDDRSWLVLRRTGGELT
jgi:serine phosphatase RsbU (regulator of sigma subunit)